MSALFAHQLSTCLQIIDSREGLSWCKMGWRINLGAAILLCINVQIIQIVGPLDAEKLRFAAK